MCWNLPAKTEPFSFRQYIRVMPDLVQIVVILMVIVGTFVVVQLTLQSSFHTAIGSFRAKNGIICGSVASGCNTGNHTFHDHGTGRHGIEQKGKHEKKPKNDGNAFLMSNHKGGGFFRVLYSLFRCFRSIPGSSALRLIQIQQRASLCLVALNGIAQEKGRIFFAE